MIVQPEPRQVNFRQGPKYVVITGDPILVAEFEMLFLDLSYPLWLEDPMCAWQLRCLSETLETGRGTIYLNDPEQWGAYFLIRSSREVFR